MMYWKTNCKIGQPNPYCHSCESGNPETTLFFWKRIRLFPGITTLTEMTMRETVCQFYNYFIFATLLLLLSACSLLPQPGEPATKYTLTPVKSTQERRAPVHPHQLAVELPTVYSPLDNNRVALVPQERQIEYYADVEWGDRLSNLIQESLVYSLQNSGRFRAVTRATEGIHANLALKCDVRKFYIQNINSGLLNITLKNQAIVEYFIQVIKLPDRAVIASRVFSHQEIVSGGHIGNFIEALDATQMNLVKNIIQWVATIQPSS